MVQILQVLATSSLQDPSQVDWRTVLPTIVSNMHDYFIAVAAKLEKTHSEVREAGLLCTQLFSNMHPGCANIAVQGAVAGHKRMPLFVVLASKKKMHGG